MLLDNKIKDIIIEAALFAPSADNSLPWQFAWQKNGDLCIYSDPSLSGSATDKTYVLTDLAIGAVLESIKLQAASLQFETQIDYFPHSDSILVATISFMPLTGLTTMAHDKQLTTYIPDRHTNRHFPFKGPITTEISQKLADSVNHDQYQLTTYTDKKQIATFIPIIKQAEAVRFKAESLHHELFKTVDFQHPAPEQGMTLNMLGIEPFARPVFRYISKWQNMHRLNKIGASKMIAIRSVTLPIKLSPALCLLTTAGNARLDIVKAGQQMMRFWLTATQLGLSVHPYAAPGVLTLAKPELTPALSGELDKVEKALTTALKGSAKALMFFRIGYCQKAAVRSHRRAAHSMLKKLS
jgi:hypothetical protein